MFPSGRCITSACQGLKDNTSSAYTRPGRAVSILRASGDGPDRPVGAELLRPLLRRILDRHFFQIDAQLHPDFPKTAVSVLKNSTTASRETRVMKNVTGTCLPARALRFSLSGVKAALAM